MCLKTIAFNGQALVLTKSLLLDKVLIKAISFEIVTDYKYQVIKSLWKYESIEELDSSHSAEITANVDFQQLFDNLFPYPSYPHFK